MEPERTSRCPSAQPGMRGLRVLGVVEITSDGPRIAYLNEEVPASDFLLSQAEPARPAEVFRLSATCEERRCVHFDGERCSLATRVATMLPPVVDALPVCLIRSSCRWFAQEGRHACVRCPQVVTECSQASDDYARAALPPGQVEV
jgi:hypothetical protein